MDPAAGKGDEKHEIYGAVFGGHLFYDLFLEGSGGEHGAPRPPGSATGKCAMKQKQLQIFIIG